MDSILIKNGTLVTMNPPGSVVQADLWIEKARIRQIAPRIAKKGATVLDATDKVVLPGFVQTHVHLCQTLMRGAADDLPLMQWLRKRIWPLEAAHNQASLRTSAQLGLAELIRGGTTTVLTMETVHGTNVVFEEVERSGIRAVVGKCLMDSGRGVPPRLRQSTKAALKECEELHRTWHEQAQGRVRVALAPRFILSCSENLLREADAMARASGLLIHTHASENREEVSEVRRLTGRRNIEAFEHLGMLSEKLCVAHCVWVSARERRLLQESGTRVLHCPSSNLKLGSGIAPVWQMHLSGIAVSCGADGAPCNNNLDMFQEIRLAALLQKALHGPEAMPAATVLSMATSGGAAALGLHREIGSLETGKQADVIIVGLRDLHSVPACDPISALVYSGKSSDVETVIVDGQVLMKDGELLTMDREKILRESQRQFQLLATRAGI
jgi:cytosine/adenosine deaminase-related metal-dependent hydrolase